MKISVVQNCKIRSWGAYSSSIIYREIGDIHKGKKNNYLGALHL